MKRMLPRLLLILLLAGLVGVAVSQPGDEPPPAPEQVPEPSEADEVDETPLETFVPSEKLPADSAVAFPVDI